MTLFGFTFSTGFLRMKRSVEMNAESTRLTNIALETNTKRWILLGSSFIGGVMIVASLLVVIKLVRILITLLVIQVKSRVCRVLHMAHQNHKNELIIVSLSISYVLLL